MTLSFSHHQAGLGPLPPYAPTDYSKTNHVVTLLPFPLNPSGVSQMPPSQENPTDNHGKTPTPPATTQSRANRNRARQGRALGAQAECDFCHKAIAANQRIRHEKHCELNPDCVEVICPECRAEFSRSDSVKRHLDSPTACPGPQSATPTLAPSSSPLRVTRKNHHGSPPTPSPISIPSQSLKPSRIRYKKNHCAPYIGRSPPVLSNVPSMSRRQYALNQSNPASQYGSDRLSLPQDAQIPLTTSENQYQASASVTPRPVLTTSAETTWQAKLVNERSTHHRCNSSPAEYMGSQAAASAPGNHEDYFPLKYTQYPAAIPYPVQGFRSSPSTQPASHFGSSRRQRAMLEESKSSFTGEDFFPGGEPAIAGYANHSQLVFSLPVFQATTPPTPTYEYSPKGTQSMDAHSTASGKSISNEGRNPSHRPYQAWCDSSWNHTSL